MKISQRWLRAYVDPAISTAELSDRLTMAGLEVESAATAAPAFHEVVVAEILDFAAHPQADRLNVCQVDTGVATNRVPYGRARLSVVRRMSRAGSKSLVRCPAPSCQAQ